MATQSRKKWLLFALLTGLMATLVLWAGRIVLSGKAVPEVKDYTSWSEEAIEAAEGIPLQDGGRIKPLSTYAKVRMLEFHGDHSIKVIGKEGEKVKVGPVAWLLDTLLRPDLSLETPTFQVENSDVLAVIGLSGEARSSHYSYNALKPSLQKLYELAQEYEKLKQEGNDLDTVQTQTLALARNVRSYETLASYFNFARAGIVLPATQENKKSSLVTTSAFMASAPVIRQAIEQAQSKGEEIPEHLVPVLQQVLSHANDAKYGLMLINPDDPKGEWFSTGDTIMRLFQLADPNPEVSLEKISLLEELYLKSSSEELPAALLGFAQKSQSTLSTQARKDLLSEVTYNKANWFFCAIFFCYLPGMIFAILNWLSPSSLWGKVTGLATWLFTSAGLILSIIGITHRSLIMHRPPVGNLYDTIIFISAGVVLIALFTELVTRRKLALGMAPFIGFFLLVLSWLYEVGEGVDNLDPLIAVLRSNFWLTVHVPTITFGYAAGLAAWLFGCVYIFVRMLGLDNDDKTLRRTITRMTYGSICFTLLLSLVGTVTGGIWANDSWGRFWGWDPKENGALMIVLWTLFMLHARAGGIIKEWGIHLAAVVTGPIVVFSWWHVNLLGVGLHSYGFSDSKGDAVNLFYLINLAVLLLGFGVAAFTKRAKKSKKAEKSPRPTTELRESEAAL